MGSEMSLQSTPGIGSTFSFTLALARSTMDAHQSPEQGSKRSSQAGLLEFHRHPSDLNQMLPPSLGPLHPSASPLKSPPKTTKRNRRRMSNSLAISVPRILIVDDEPVNRKLLERTFLRAAQKLCVAAPTIVLAVNGQEAVDLVAASLPSSLDTIDVERGAGMRSQPFALICLDRQMPVLDGVGATREIRTLEVRCFTAASLSTRSSQALKPAYLVGMSASIENTEEWLAAGLDEMLPKPFTAPDIKELLLAMYPSKPRAKKSALAMAAASEIAAASATSLPGGVPEAIHPDIRLRVLSTTSTLSLPGSIAPYTL
jgi:CheY-like chemotaxis protein